MPKAPSRPQKLKPATQLKRKKSKPKPEPIRKSTPKPIRGGARPGAGRPASDTVPITVRLHPLTIRCLQARNRSADIERILLDHLLENYSALRSQVPALGKKILALRRLRARLAEQHRGK